MRREVPGRFHGKEIVLDGRTHAAALPCPARLRARRVAAGGTASSRRPFLSLRFQREGPTDGRADGCSPALSIKRERERERPGENLAWLTAPHSVFFFFVRNFLRRVNTPALVANEVMVSNALADFRAFSGLNEERFTPCGLSWWERYGLSASVWTAGVCRRLVLYLIQAAAEQRSPRPILPSHSVRHTCL